MATDVATLLELALQLPAEARAQLAGALVSSLDDEEPLDQPAYDAAWGTEIARRLDEVDQGTVEAMSWTDARRQILGD